MLLQIISRKTNIRINTTKELSLEIISWNLFQKLNHPLAALIFYFYRAGVKCYLQSNDEKAHCS